MANRTRQELVSPPRAVASCPNLSEISCSTTTEDVEAVSIPGTPDPFECYCETRPGSRGLPPPTVMTRFSSAPPPVVISLSDQIPMSNNTSITKVVSLNDLLRHEFKRAAKSESRRKRRMRRVISNPSFRPALTRFISLDVIQNIHN